MPMIEIDEAQLLDLKNASGTLGLLLGNPKTRGTVLKAVKEIRPDVAIPEVDAAAPVQAGIAEMQKELAEFRASVAKEKEEREHAEKQAKALSRWEQGKAELRSEGWTDEAIGKIEELMEKEGIASHAAGAAYFERLNPPAAPLAGGSARAMLPVLDQGARENSEYLKKIFEGDLSDGTLMGEVNAALREARTGR